MKTEHQPVAARPAALGPNGKPAKGVPEKLDLHLDLDAHETHVHKIPKDLIQRMRERAAEARAQTAESEDEFGEEPLSGVQDDRTAVFRPPPELLARAKRMQPPSKPNPISEAPTKPPPPLAAEDQAAAEFSVPPYAAAKSASPSVSQKPRAPMTPVVPAPTAKSYAPKTPAQPFSPARLAPMTPMAPAPSVKPLAKTPAQAFTAHKAPVVAPVTASAPAPAAAPKPGFLAPAPAAVAKDQVTPASERRGAPVSVGRVVPVAAVGLGSPSQAARESSPSALVEPLAPAGRDTIVDESSLPRDYTPASSSRHERPSVPRQYDAPSSTRLRDVPSTPRNERPSTHGERPSTHGERPSAHGERPSAHGERPSTHGDVRSAPRNDVPSAPRQEMPSYPRVSGEMSMTDAETDAPSPLARNLVIFVAALGVAALLVWLRTH